ncbi:hypothetical protein C7B80_10210 [Cyanosarcina cf. burmensis CCALA 770]|nr:hypothetical protein C7B80_10210 [Cyanosarcina cf. burmensis CCALA 770]
MVDFSELNRKYPRITDLEPADFQRLSVDRQMNDFWREEAAYRASLSAKNFVPTADTPDPKINIQVPSVDRPEFRPYERTSPWKTQFTEPTLPNRAAVHPSAPPSTPESSLLRPAPASPPPTPATSGAGSNPNLRMESPPPPAAPKQAVGYADPRPSALPSNVPEPAGVGAVGAAAAQAIAKNAAYGSIGAAAASFTYDVITGRPPLDAAGKALATGAGTAFGTALGSGFGPVGMFLGGAIGGAVGGALYDRFFHPTSAHPQKEGYVGKVPFTGGQMNADYHFWGSRIWGCPFGGYDKLNKQSGGTLVVKGPIVSISEPVFASTSGGCLLFAVEIVTATQTVTGYFSDRAGDNGKNISFPPSLVNGQADTGGDTSTRLPVPTDNRTYITINQYGNAGYAPPRAELEPAPAPNAYAPGGLPIDKLPSAVPVGEPHPDTAPPRMLLPDPQPTGVSNNTTNNPPGGSVTFDPTTGVVTFVAPGSPAASNPALNPWHQTLPFSPTTLQSSPLTSSNFSTAPNPDHATTSSISTTAQPTPTPDATSPVPKSQPAPSLTPATAPATAPEVEKLRTEFQEQFTNLGLGMVAITQILQGIQNNTATETIRNAAQEGTCQSLNGGCTTGVNINQQVSNAANNSAAANALLQGADLALLGVIDSKLGAQIPNGGIGGFLQRAFQATRLDKILNALTFILALHNAAMLSRSLGATLGDLTSQALTTIGIKDENGSPLDINAEIGRQVNNLMTAVLGVETWEGTKTAWNKANAILSSANQIMWMVRSLFDSGREVTEWIANNTGKIGNALKRFRVVGEDAYPHMSENVTHQNAWMLKVQRYREGVDTLDDAASSFQGVLGEVQNIQQEAQELNEQKQRFDNAIRDAQPKTIPENTPVKDKADATKIASASPATQADVFRGEGETSNA